MPSIWVWIQHGRDRYNRALPPPPPPPLPPSPILCRHSKPIETPRQRTELQKRQLRSPPSDPGRYPFSVYVALLLLCCMQEAGQYLAGSPVPRDLAARPETPGTRIRRPRDAAIADSRAMRAAIIPVSTLSHTCSWTIKRPEAWREDTLTGS